MTIHRYTTTIAWAGSTGAGYREYSRTHRASAEGTGLQLSADASFGGDANLLNPEQLLVMAASSCQMLSFLAAAARQGLDVVAYDDHAEGRMDDRGAAPRLDTIWLRPTIAVATGTAHHTVRQLVERAHEACFIANSLASAVIVEATVVSA